MDIGKNQKMNDKQMLFSVIVLVIGMIVIRFIARIGEGVENMKLSYKLVIDKSGTITEEAFENFELMLERVKALEAENATPATPATTPATPAVDVNGQPIPPVGGDQSVA